MVTDRRKCAKLQILVKLWLTEPNSNVVMSMNLNMMANTLLQQMRVIINMNASVTLLAKTLTAQTKWMATNPKMRKSPNQSFFSDWRTNRKK